MMIVTTFFLCNLPRLILNMHEIFALDSLELCKATLLGGFPLWAIFLGYVSHVLLVINSSANLIIYCIIGAKLRQQFSSYFCIRDCRN